MKRVELAADMFQGAISLEKGDGWVRPWRIPFDQRGLFPSPGNRHQETARNVSCVRLRFATESIALRLSCLPNEAKRFFDLTINGKIVQTAAAEANEDAVTFRDLTAEDKVVELWLPLGYPAELRYLELDDETRAEVVPDPRKKWVTYGSSITNCGNPHSPACVWPAIVAREMGFNITSLGYGGQCHVRPMTARMIRDLPADYISLELGINVHGTASLATRTFKPAIIGMVQIIREKHPETPIAVISSVIATPHETTENAVGFTLQAMRVEVEDAVLRIVDVCGDKNLHYFDGTTLLGEADVDYLPDGIHPNPQGAELLARRFVGHVFGKIA